MTLKPAVKPSDENEDVNMIEEQWPEAYEDVLEVDIASPLKAGAPPAPHPRMAASPASGAWPPRCTLRTLANVLRL